MYIYGYYDTLKCLFLTSYSLGLDYLSSFHIHKRNKSVSFVNMKCCYVLYCNENKH
jgi:hypothetical protein